MYEEIPKGPLRHGAALVLALLLCTTAALAAEPVQRSLIPVGHTVGVKLFARGVVVVKLPEGGTPARTCGLKTGDVIVECGGEAVTSTEQFQSLLQKNGTDATALEIKRQGSPLTLSVEPERNEQGVCCIGAWIRDSMAGIGTVTYYDPADGKTKNLVGMDPMDIRKSGIAMSFVPEDRLGMGLVGSMGMTGNMMLRSWKKGKGVFVNRKDPNELAMTIWKELEVVTPSTEFPVRRMSGGNVQKVLVGREIASAPNVLMSAYAVRGLDINTSYTIYNLMTEQKMKGVAVIFVGEDLDVLLELCDRILVLCGGKVSGIVDARTATKEEIGLMMTRVGGGKEEAVHA